MSENSSILFLMLAAGVGVALFFAAREFMRGVNEVRRDRSRDQAKHQGEEENRVPKDHESIKSWHEVLEVSPSAGTQQIKVAYRQMIVLYHPDRVNNLGVELQNIAEIRTKEINEAYSTARKLHGF
jgi:DnaJ-domain-containing protein 1